MAVEPVPNVYCQCRCVITKVRVRMTTEEAGVQGKTPRTASVDPEQEETSVRVKSTETISFRQKRIEIKRIEWPTPSHYKFAFYLRHLLPSSVRNHGIFSPTTEPVDSNVIFQWYDVPAVITGQGLNVFHLVVTVSVISWLLGHGLKLAGLLALLSFLAYLVAVTALAAYFTMKENKGNPCKAIALLPFAALQLLPFIRAGEYVYNGLQSRKGQDDTVTGLGENEEAITAMKVAQLEARTKLVEGVEMRHNHLAILNMTEALLETFVQAVVTLATIFGHGSDQFDIFGDQGRAVATKVFLGWLRVSWRMTCLQAAIRNINKKSRTALKQKVVSTIYRASETAIVILTLSYCCSRSLTSTEVLLSFMLFRTVTYYWCIVRSTKDEVGDWLCVLLALTYNIGFVSVGKDRSRGVSLPYYLFLYYPLNAFQYLIVLHYTAYHWDDRLFILSFLVPVFALFHVPVMLAYFLCFHPSKSKISLCAGLNGICQCRSCCSNVCPRPELPWRKMSNWCHRNFNCSLNFCLDNPEVGAVIKNVIVHLIHFGFYYGLMISLFEHVDDPQTTTVASNFTTVTSNFTIATVSTHP